MLPYFNGVSLSPLWVPLFFESPLIYPEFIEGPFTAHRLLFTAPLFIMRITGDDGQDKV
jgi:hypothetical protein